jgi:hypothetical protein
LLSETGQRPGAAGAETKLIGFGQVLRRFSGLRTLGKETTFLKIFLNTVDTENRLPMIVSSQAGSLLTGASQLEKDESSRLVFLG